MADQLSAEAQALVEEGMRLASEICLAPTIESTGDLMQSLRAHLARMAAMAAPQGEPVVWLHGEGDNISICRLEPGNRHLANAFPVFRGAPQAQPARAPMSEERIRELGEGAFGITINFDGHLMIFARAIEREIAQGEQP